MANNKTTYVLEIDAEVGQLKQKLENTKNALDKIGASNFSADLGKKINTILAQLEKLQKKAGQPIDSKSTFSNLEKGFGDIIVDAKNLLGELEKISHLTAKEKISLLPEGEAKKLKEAIAAVQTYTRAVEKAEKARIRAQERRRLDYDATSTSLREAKSSRAASQSELNKATARGTEYGDAKAILVQATAAEKAEKEIDQLQKTLKKYQKQLEELNKVENKTVEQEAELETIRSNIKSVSGKIGARTKTVQKTPDERTVTAAKRVVEEQEPHIEALTLQVAQADKEISRLEGTLTKLDEAIRNNSTEITNSQADYKILYEQAKKLGISLDGVTEDVNPENIQILTLRLNELVQIGIKPIEDAVTDATPELKQLGIVAQETGERIEQASEHFDALSDNNTRIETLKNNIKQFIGWAGAARVLSAAARNAFQDIKQLDAAMTEIAVVTDFEIGDMWEQMPTYTERANELGLAITEVYEASALYYQQGLNTEEMIALSNQTLKMAKIAGLDAAEATDRMTAALRGFNMELNEASAQKVADVYSELAAVTASDVDEISSAMTKTASIAASAGMEFETTAAFLSQIIETTRESAETAGTAMKTVVARFQELKKSPDEIGEVDGEIVDANAIETALRSVGVALRDTNGQFRELDEVFLELSSKWDGLDKNTQRYIATIAAGSRQQSRFIAMMQDHKRTQELVTAANTSAGASQKQYEKTLESIETKLAQLDNAWTEFSTGLMNNDLVKFAVTFLTKLLNTLNKVTKGFEGFTGSLSKIGTLVAIFQTAKTVINKFFDDTIAKVYTSAIKAGQKIADGTKKGIEATSGVDVSTTAKDRGSFVDRAIGYSQINEGVNSIQQGRNQQAEVAKLQANKKIAEMEMKANLEYATSRVTQKDSNISAKKSEIAALKREREAMDAGEASPSQKASKTKQIQKQEQQLLQLTKEREEAEKNRAALEIENTKEIQKLKDGIVKKEKEANEAIDKGFRTIQEGAQQVSQTLVLVGTGLGLIGQMFEDANLEGVGNVFNIIGQGLTFVGSAIAVLIPLLPILGRVFKKTGEEGQKSGLKALSGWAWVAIVIVALMALAVVVALIAKAIQKASPEAKLAKAQEAADEAAEAANRAKESYENLSKSLDDLGGKYDALEELTKGTEEWHKAVNEINDSVLNLIEQYPELAKFAENIDGVLTIDTDSSEVLGVLNEYKNKSTQASIAALSAKVQVNEAKKDVAYGSLGRKARVSDSDAYGNAEGNFEGKRKERKEQRTTALARALEEGLIREYNGSFEMIGENQEYSRKRLKELGLDPDALHQFDNEVYESVEDLKEYGETIGQLDEETKALYDAIAAQARSMADMSGWAEEEVKQAANLVSGDDVMRYQASIEKTYEDDDSKTTEEALRAFMLQQEGVSEVKKIKNNKIVYIDDEGKKQKVDKQVYIDKMIAAKAAEKATSATVGIKKAIDLLASNLEEVLQGKGKGFVQGAGASAVEKLFADETGKNLTESEIGMLKTLTEEEKKAAYEGNENLQQAFGTVEEFLKYFNDTIDNADDVFVESRRLQEEINRGQAKTLTLVKSYMTGGQSEAYLKKMSTVFQLSGFSGVESVDNALNTAMAGKNDEEKQQILDFVDSYDWSNADELNNLQLQLWQTYEIGEDASRDLVNAIKQASYSITSMATVVNEFGELRQASEALAAETVKITELQNKYNMALKNGSSNLGELISDIVASYKNQYKIYGQQYQSAMENLSTIYAQGADKSRFGGVDLTTLIDFHTDEDGNILGIDTSELAKYPILQGNEEVQKYLEDMEKTLDDAQEAREGQQSVLEGIEELETENNEAYNELWNLVKDQLLSALQEQIDIQSETLAATQEANDQIFSKIQETINTQRQQDQNAETEENISNMYSQLNALNMDTSGANAVAGQQLEKEIEDAEKSYEETLIDQTLQSLQDANDRAAEQRERQIALQESALEMYQESAEFQAKIDSNMAAILSSEEPVNELLSQAIVKDQTLGLNDKERNEYLLGYAAMVQQAAAASGLDISLDDIMNEFSIGGTQKSEVISKAQGKAETERRSQYAQKGFTSAASSEATNSQQLKTIDDYLAKEKQASIDSNLKTLERAENSQIISKNDYLSEYDYYQQHENEIKAGTHTQTYTEYLESKVKDIGPFENLTAAEAFGGIAVPGSAEGFKDWKGKDQYRENELFDAKVNGKQDTGVKLGSKVTNSNLKTQLDKIHFETGSDSMPYVYLATDAQGRGVDMLYYRQGGGTWWEVKNENEQKHGTYPRGLRDAAKSYMDSQTAQKYVKHKKYNKYKTGGLADFTGPAWLDGTPSKPEYILNAAQTERFFSLIDILEEYNKNGRAEDNGGDNYFDININVDSLSSDYDVEQMANKIRKMLYEDATYRNVNAINHKR